MIRYLISRPISVFVSFGIAVILGVIAYIHIPTSILPDIPIPEIIIKINADDLSARQIENTIVRPFRTRLSQLANLRELESKAQDEMGFLNLSFEYGTSMGLTFIEVNEKIDQTMASLPKEVSRPQVIRVNASDIPVMDLVLTLKDDLPYSRDTEQKFIEMSNIAEQVIKSRLEQLPQVAMIDASGIWGKKLSIRLDPRKIASLDIDEQRIKEAFQAQVLETSQSYVRQGDYIYSVRFEHSLKSLEDIKQILLKQDDRIFRLQDIASVGYQRTDIKGDIFRNGKRAIVFSVIKQDHAKMEELQQEVQNTVDNFQEDYPEIDIETTQDQSKLLRLTLASLKQNLLFGIILIFIITLFFIRQFKLPLIIVTSLLISLIISVGLFYLFDISLNVISLSGLILSVGMMIDNSIIVVEDITQHHQRSHSVKEACVRGTQEVISPLLSSTLTTIAVFLPLVFLNGIAGAIFYDQAMAITLSLLASYATAILLIPVVYFVLYSSTESNDKMTESKFIDKFYEWGFLRVFKYKKIAVYSVLSCIPFCYILYHIVEKDKMPTLTQNEVIVDIDWNENISLRENRERSFSIVENLQTPNLSTSVYMGRQQFLIRNIQDLSSSQTRIYVEVANPDSLLGVKNEIHKHFKQYYPAAHVSYSASETVFESIFNTSKPELQLEIFSPHRQVAISTDSIRNLCILLQTRLNQKIDHPVVDQHFQLNIDQEKLLMHDLTRLDLENQLYSQLGNSQFTTLNEGTHDLPVYIERENKTLDRVLNETFVSSSSNKGGYPLSEFITVSLLDDFRDIYGGVNGEYIPLQFYEIANVSDLPKRITEVMVAEPNYRFHLSGLHFENAVMMSSLITILIIAIVMMYLIMTAQFESFVQPLILLIEIPIDITFSLLCLYLFGYTLNLMSAIGIIVACGIIVNDSILKINLVNELRAEGLPVFEALHEAGKRRARAIVMTSLTTIFAFIPLFFSRDLGSDLQRPLAIGLIGAMVVGTLVSLFIVPLFYWIVYHNKVKL